MEMEITFPGGKKVNSTYKGFTVETDQPKDEGGDGTAPEPYDLFLSSIGTCAGVYVVYFCDERGIDMSDLKMTVRFDRNEKKIWWKRSESISICRRDFRKSTNQRSSKSPSFAR